MDITRFSIDAEGVARLEVAKGVLIMDADDLHILEGPVCIKWNRTQAGYPAVYADVWTSKRPRKRVGALSRLIMNAPVGGEVDHINHDTLDNRKQNLRLCTHAENAMNGRRQTQSKSRFKGVYYHPAKRYKPNSSEAKPWRAYAKINQKRIWLGYYATEEEAAIAYDLFAIKTFGEFACPNMLDVKTHLLGP